MEDKNTPIVPFRNETIDDPEFDYNVAQGELQEFDLSSPKFTRGLTLVIGSWAKAKRPNRLQRIIGAPPLINMSVIRTDPNKEYSVTNLSSLLIPEQAFALTYRLKKQTLSVENLNPEWATTVVFVDEKGNQIAAPVQSTTSIINLKTPDTHRWRIFVSKTGNQQTTSRFDFTDQDGKLSVVFSPDSPVIQQSVPGL